MIEHVSTKMNGESIWRAFLVSINGMSMENEITAKIVPKIPPTILIINSSGTVVRKKADVVESVISLHHTDDWK